MDGERRKAVVDAGAALAALVSTGLAAAAVSTETHATPCSARQPSGLPTTVEIVAGTFLLLAGVSAARLRGGGRLHDYVVAAFILAGLAIGLALLLLPTGPPGCGD